MPEQLAGRDLAWLERRRPELFSLISQAGDFRRGALNAIWRRCGKPNCTTTPQGLAAAPRRLARCRGRILGHAILSRMAE
jgi:hypothetical protein